MSRSRRLLRATAITSGMGYLNQVASLVVVPIYLSGLGAEAYGLMLTYLSLAGYFALADGGLSWGAMILMGQAWGRGDRDEFARVFRHGVVLAAASGLLAVLVAAGVFAADRHGWKLPFAAGSSASLGLLAVVGLQSAAAPLVAMIYNAHFAVQEAHWPALLQGGARLMGSIAGAWVALVTHNPIWVLVANVAANWGVALVAAGVLFRRHRWVFATGAINDSRQYRTQIRTGGKNFLLQLAKVVTGTAPILVLGSLAGSAAVPLYTLSVTIVQFVVAPITHWSGTAQTAYGEAWTSGKREWAVNTFTRALRISLLVGGVLVGVGSFCIPPAIAILSHGKLAVPTAMALGITLAGSLTMLTTQFQFALTGINRQRTAALIEIGNAIATIVLCAVGIYWVGPVAVGWMLSAASLLVGLQFLPREFARQFGLTSAPFELGSMLKLLLAVLVSAGSVAWVHVRMEWSLPLQLAAIAAVALGGAAVYAALCSVLRTEAWGELAALLRPKFKSLP